MFIFHPRISFVEYQLLITFSMHAVLLVRFVPYAMFCLFFSTGDYTNQTRQANFWPLSQAKTEVQFELLEGFLCPRVLCVIKICVCAGLWDNLYSAEDGD